MKLRKELAQALLRTGYSRNRLGRVDEAEPLYREGIDRVFQVLQDWPADPVSRNDLGIFLAMLRVAQKTRERFADTIAYERTIADNLKRLSERDPDDLFWLNLLAISHRYQGLLHLRLGHSSDAESEFHHERDLLERAAGVPTAPQDVPLNFAWFLANSPMRSLRDPQKARDIAGRIWDAPAGRTTQARLVLAAANNGLGHYEEAARLLEPLTTSNPAGATDLWQHWAIAQHHLGHEAQAHEALRKVALWIKEAGKPALERQFNLAEVNELCGNPEPSLIFPPK